MNVRKRRSRAVGGEFDRKLLRYALAGTTILSAPALAKANIPGITQSGTATSNSATGSRGIPIAFDDAAHPDFYLFAAAYGNTTQAYAEVFGYVSPGVRTFLVGPAFTGTNASTAIYPSAFPSATAVPQGPVTGIRGGLLSKDTLNFGSYAKSGFVGNFPVPGDAYLGVIFTIGHAQYLGSVEVSLAESLGTDPTATVTVLGTSYDPTPTPEPAYLPLYALGAAALGLRLKRRSHSKTEKH